MWNVSFVVLLINTTYKCLCWSVLPINTMWNVCVGLWQSFLKQNLKSKSMRLRTSVLVFCVSRKSKSKGLCWSIVSVVEAKLKVCVGLRYSLIQHELLFTDLGSNEFNLI
jgi:hypothetical protein